MANDPLGDIEILSPPPPQTRKQDSKKKEDTAAPSSNNMRIRFLRRSSTVELSRYTAPQTQTAAIAGEWSKKVIRVISKDSADLQFVDADTTTLDTADWDGMNLLCNFLPLCDTVAAWGRDNHSIHAPASTIIGREDTQRRQLAEILSPSDPTTSALPRVDLNKTGQKMNNLENAAAASSTVLSQVDLTHRPSKLSPAGSSTKILPKAPPEKGLSGSSSSNTLTYSSTKFLPTVGWCTRTGLQDEHLQYKILFLDGVSLEVNAGDGSVEHTRADGTVDRYVTFLGGVAPL